MAFQALTYTENEFYYLCSLKRAYHSGLNPEKAGFIGMRRNIRRRGRFEETPVAGSLPWNYDRNLSFIF